MTLQAGVAPGDPPPWPAADSDTPAGDVLRRWAALQDTADIATATGIPQADACRIISADQNRRHALKQMEQNR